MQTYTNTINPNDSWHHNWSWLWYPAKPHGQLLLSILWKVTDLLLFEAFTEWICCVLLLRIGRISMELCLNWTCALASTSNVLHESVSTLQFLEMTLVAFCGKSPHLNCPGEETKLSWTAPNYYVFSYLKIEIWKYNVQVCNWCNCSKYLMGNSPKTENLKVAFLFLLPVLPPPPP